MKSLTIIHRLTIMLSGNVIITPAARAATLTNPVTRADIPDISIVRVNDKYYTTSTKSCIV